jgi:hypothetical protein
VAARRALELAQADEIHSVPRGDPLQRGAIRPEPRPVDEGNDARILGSSAHAVHVQPAPRSDRADDRAFVDSVLGEEPVAARVPPRVQPAVAVTVRRGVIRSEVGLT